MSYCSSCGNKLEENSMFCSKCGASIRNETIVVPVKTYGALKFFMVLACVLNAFAYLIPLCWCIPMTVKLFNKIKNREKVSTAFKVCSLLFVSTIAGILLLCDNDL